MVAGRFFWWCLIRAGGQLTLIIINAEAGWFFGLDDETIYCLDLRILEERAQKNLVSVSVLKTKSVR